MSDVTRLFTVAAANRLVPLLERTFKQIREQRDELRDAIDALQELGYDFTGEATPDDMPAQASSMFSRCSALHQDILSALNELIELGVEVKGIEGLVDVRSRYRGRIVYLCWRTGEASFLFWHELDAGFAGRIPITEPDLFEGMLLN